MKNVVRHIGRGFFSLLVFAMWYIAANRCLLGLMPVVSPENVATTCCSQSTPEKAPTKHVPQGHVCCKSLQGLNASGAEVKLPPIYFAESMIFPSVIRMIPSLVAEQEFYSDTGPPGASFSELVLSRSLQSHAPPALG